METSKTLYYIAKGTIKHSAKDDFETGCEIKGKSTFIDDEIKADSLKELIAAIMMEYGVKDKKNVLLNACGEIGRLDIQVYEKANGIAANSADMKRWEKGERGLWLCDYSFNVEEVITEVMDFDNMEGADEYTLNN